MSFASDLKTELCGVHAAARHCRLSQLAGMICFLNGRLSPDKKRILLSSENMAAANSAAELIKKLFGEETPITTDKSARNLQAYCIDINSEISAEIFEALKMGTDDELTLHPGISLLTGKSCCKRAIIRGAFISAGSVSNPDKFYHLEIKCRDAFVARETSRIMNAISLQSRISKRKNHYIIYLKEIEQISESLGLMGARTSLLELENFRIIREMRGNVNRRVNCETANINKAAQAAARQIEDIIYIKEHMGLSALPNGLDEMAKIRVEYPEATLSELGELLDPPVGKSGVNHRLR